MLTNFRYDIEVGRIAVTQDPAGKIGIASSQIAKRSSCVATWSQETEYPPYAGDTNSTTKVDWHALRRPLMDVRRKSGDNMPSPRGERQ